MTYREHIDAIVRELAKARRWEPRIVPVAVALTQDQKDEILYSLKDDSLAVTDYSQSGSLRIFGLPIAVMPDDWKGPLVLLSEKVTG